MLGWLKERLDLAAAVAIIGLCLFSLAWRFAPGRKRAVSAEEIRESLAALNAAMERNDHEPVAIPDYLGAFAANMARTDRVLQEAELSWVMHPRPPFVVGDLPDPPKIEFVAQSRPEISIGAPGVGECRLRISFGSGTNRWLSRALRVWRKPADAPQWPVEPMLIIQATAGRDAALPPGVTAVEGGYEIALGDLRPRERWEYRARAAVVFPEQTAELVDGKPRITKFKLPEAAVDRQDLLEDQDSAARCGCLLADVPPGCRLLGGGPLFTRFSEPLAVMLRGDTQVSYEAPVSIDGKETANFRVRRHCPGATSAGADGWCARLERFAPGDEIRIPNWVLLIKDPAGGPNRRETLDVDSGLKLVSLFSKPRSNMSALRVAVVEERSTGRRIELLARADGGDWWPEDARSVPPGQ